MDRDILQNLFFSAERKHRKILFANFNFSIPSHGSLKMLLKTVYRTQAHCSISSVERDIHKNHRKVAERKHRKVLLANFNFSILDGSGGTFFLLLFCRKKKKKKKKKTCE